jgi:hypothetical protein
MLIQVLTLSQERIKKIPGYTPRYSASRNYRTDIRTFTVAKESEKNLPKCQMFGFLKAKM